MIVERKEIQVSDYLHAKLCCNTRSNGIYGFISCYYLFNYLFSGSIYMQCVYT